LPPTHTGGRGRCTGGGSRRADFSSTYNIDDNSVTWSAGGGVMLFFGTRVGMRFDLRYFRTFDDLEILGVTLADSPGKLDFTRTSLGFIVRF